VVADPATDGVRKSRGLRQQDQRSDRQCNEPRRHRAVRRALAAEVDAVMEAIAQGFRKPVGTHMSHRGRGRPTEPSQEHLTDQLLVNLAGDREAPGDRRPHREVVPRQAPDRPARIPEASVLAPEHRPVDRRGTDWRPDRTGGGVNRA
jgi:hypothetical protein